MVCYETSSFNHLIRFGEIVLSSIRLFIVSNKSCTNIHPLLLSYLVCSFICRPIQMHKPSPRGKRIF